MNCSVFFWLLDLRHMQQKSLQSSVLPLCNMGIVRTDAIAAAPASNFQKEPPLPTTPSIPPSLPTVSRSERWKRHLPQQAYCRDRG